MTKQAIIEHIILVINQLPEDKAAQISDFADYIIKKHEDSNILDGIQLVLEQSKTFEFLKEEEDLYSESDLKIKYNAKG
jgi:hypothetical protein